MPTPAKKPSGASRSAASSPSAHRRPAVSPPESAPPPPPGRTPGDKPEEILRSLILRHLTSTLARYPGAATARDWWVATALATRDQIHERMIATQQRQDDLARFLFPFLRDDHVDQRLDLAFGSRAAGERDQVFDGANARRRELLDWRVGILVNYFGNA